MDQSSQIQQGDVIDVRDAAELSTVANPRRVRL